MSVRWQPWVAGLLLGVAGALERPWLGAAGAAFAAALFLLPPRLRPLALAAPAALVLPTLHDLQGLAAVACLAGALLVGVWDVAGRAGRSLGVGGLVLAVLAGGAALLPRAAAFLEADASLGTLLLAGAALVSLGFAAAMLPQESRR